LNPYNRQFINALRPEFFLFEKPEKVKRSHYKIRNRYGLRDLNSAIGLSQVKGERRGWLEDREGYETKQNKRKGGFYDGKEDYGFEE
jgi:hypothetical protein